MERRTKIVCTLGPSSSTKETIREMIIAGMDVVRLNFSHGTHAEHLQRMIDVREAAAELGKNIPIMQDLQGPKIRVGLVREDAVLIRKGQMLILTSEDIEIGDEKRVQVHYANLEESVSIGSRVLIDDGALELEIVEVKGKDIYTEVIVGGPLRSRKGVHFPKMKASSPSLTKKDIDDLKFGLDHGVDIIALSFVRGSSDVTDLMKRITARGQRVTVVAKIEKPEAVEDIDEILLFADGIMVARGDLGIEMPLSKVPGTQKDIIRRCLHASTPVITATQMLESMIENPRPTRAEASDVANAVLDGSDAVMLSGETAAGKYPIRVVEVMSKIIREAEAYYPALDRNFFHSDRVPSNRMELITESVSYNAFHLAQQVGASAIVCLTASGTTARSIARHRPMMPVYAFTDDPRVVMQLGLLWGTKAIEIPFQRDTDQGLSVVHEVLKKRGLVEEGDYIVMTAGMPLPAKGRTNMVHVSKV
ncbi:MAG: pyruvate kinase [Rhodothermales bacterium]|nr:pyruvate kinase [Rhodothermales bacterium]